MVYEFLCGLAIHAMFFGIVMSGVVWIIGWLFTFVTGIFKDLGKE